MVGWSVRGRRRVPAAAQGLPRFSGGASPMRSQWMEPAGAGGGVGPPSEGWAALNGEQEEERRRSTDGAGPAEDETNHYIHRSVNKPNKQQANIWINGWSHE